MSRLKSSYLQKRRSQVTNASQKEPRQCPLLDPDLPIISDVEHKAGRCLCHHCVCGAHVCPNQRLEKFGSSWRTSYNTEFNKKKTQNSSPFRPQEYKSFLKSAQGKPAVSVSHSDYKPQTLTRSASCKPETFTSQTKFNGRSSYEREFTEWKNNALIVEASHLPYRGYMIKPWKLESVYAETFRDFGLRKGPLWKGADNDSVGRLIQASDEKCYETTSSSFFTKEQRSKSRDSLVGSIRNSSLHASPEVVKGHYATAYSSSFIPHPQKPALSRLRH